MSLDEAPQNFRIIAADAMNKWEALTHTNVGRSSFRYGDLDVLSMNDNLRESLDLDPEGITTLLLLEVFLRDFLEKKNFSAAEIMRDYKRWSRNFGPVVKVDCMMREVIQNEETKEPFARVQSQGCA